MKTGIVAPSRQELEPFLKRCENVEATKRCGFEFFTATLFDNELVCVICGICKTNAACATQALLDGFDVSRVFLLGVCGAISPSLKIKDTIVCTSVAHHDVEQSILTQNEPRFASAAFECDKTLLNAVQRAELNGLPYGVKLVYGKEVTGESFVDRDGREQIVAAHSPLGVDMETAAAAQVCALNRVPFLALRTVTDTPFESGLEVFGKNLASASEICALALYETLKQL